MVLSRHFSFGSTSFAIYPFGYYFSIENIFHRLNRNAKSVTIKENGESVLAQLGIPMATAIDLLAPDNAMGQ